MEKTLFKEQLSDSFEDHAEVIALESSKYLGIQIAEYDLAQIKDSKNFKQLRVITFDFKKYG